MTSTTTLEVGQNLIHRLRETVSKGVSVWGDLQKEAADAIEALQAENERLKESCASWGKNCAIASKERDDLAAKLVPLTDERKYKLLGHGDEIQKGDTVLDYDATTWHPLAGWEVGMKWGGNLMPMRRAIESAHGIQAKGGQHEDA